MDTRNNSRFISKVALYISGILILSTVFVLPANAGTFVAFESGQVRPLALSPDSSKLFVVNTPDNTLEIFNVNSGTPVLTGSVQVGLEPVAVAARTNTEIWVVNYLSDSISIVDISGSTPRVTRTLLVGDEPADIVFAGPGSIRAFITTAHRGQNSPYTSATNPGELITPGIGRADVWVFDATSLGSSLGGTPLTIVTLFGDTPKALTVSPDGSTVYAAIFKSGNQTTALSEGIICDGGENASSCTVDGVTAPGGLPAPSNQTIGGIPQPETGLIVRYNGTSWLDEIGRNWSNLVRFNLPDKDVFAINANATPPVEVDAYTGVGTVLYNMAVNPVSGKVYVANTEARNEVRFEGERAPGSTVSTVRGHQHETRITVITPGTGSVVPRHLNKHIDYDVTPSPAGVSDDSLSIPKGMAVTSNGNTLYLAAKGSAKIGVFNTAALENNTFVPDAASHIVLTGGGPGGLILDEVNNRLYVTTRFDNSISVIDTNTNTEINHIALHNPEPVDLVAGRPFMFDANITSSNGEATCASCHIEGDKDELAWDLGDPDGAALNNPNPFTVGPFGDPDFHPMKGPMTTQTLRGMDTHGPMHWRGDRTAGNDAGGDPLDENAGFQKFNPAFVGLLGRSTELSPAEMQAYADFVLQLTPPPNPIRALDDSLNVDQQAGKDFYNNVISDGVASCNGCHVLAPPTFFGASGNSSFEAEPQHMKIPHLRNIYEKVGMFGMPDVAFFNAGDNGHQGDQIRGFGYLHDGSVDTPFRFLDAALFNFSGGDAQRRQVEQFLFAFDSNLKPIVGQQITLTNTNSTVTNPRIDLLIARANAGDADLIFKSIIAGEQRGGYYNGSAFVTDKIAESPMSDPSVRTLAVTAGQEVTYMAVPVGSGNRIGIDRDEDTILNGDDNCPAVANPGQEDSNSNNIGDVCEPDTDGDGIIDSDDNCPFVANASQLDTDSDLMGDACDPDDDNDGLSDAEETIIGTSTILADTDGDNLSDFYEVNYDGSGTYTSATDLDPLSLDTDNDGFNDDVELAENSDPLDDQDTPADGDLNTDGLVNMADLLIAYQIALGEKTATPSEQLHGDVAPQPAGIPVPDGNINAADVLLIEQKVMGLRIF